ncbi:unnamed protein product [Cyclocybe aegerita]|uniref:Uncharacterized protein n=1 Tax=Cyclocybe aegerita TaxID=1973307 RepID=A0A8S0WFY1_CYCAE|nr:unnamed protein product [Cyclocybe aegerita]
MIRLSDRAHGKEVDPSEPFVIENRFEHLEVLPTTNVPTQISFPPLTINAPPKTDLWRKPPHIDVDNIPTIFLPKSIDLNKFRSANVTVSGEWNTLYDQGGLVLYIFGEGLKKWVKTGIEFVFGKPFVGTVATARASDWSLVPLSESAGGKVTVHVERETKDDERLESLWVYVIGENGETLGVREVTWVFGPDVIDCDNPTSEERTMLVGVYGARPTVPEGEGRENEELVVKLDGFKVALFDD